jgi:uncharacterized membrane protein
MSEGNSMEREGARLASIDALRGFVMILMLIDHVRETFFLHRQVGDPVDAATVEPALFFTRWLSTLCAPVFVALAGLSAWLYGRKHGKREASWFLLKRGCFLLFLELTFVGFAWSAQFPPRTFWLQVIWAIGVCMIALAALLHLSRAWRFGIGVAIICGHNLLDPIVLTPDSPWFVPWAMLHQRAVIDLGGGMVAKTTYPVFAWIGVMLLGHVAGPWFARDVEPARRIRRLTGLGVGLLIAFVLIRWTGVYGDKPWSCADDGLRTFMAFLSLTKYPPSLLFLLSTLGAGSLLLALFEKWPAGRLPAALAVFGAAPMFFYLLHLYVLRGLYLIGLAIWGPNQGTYFGFDRVSSVWICGVILLAALYFPTRWFAGVKRRRKDLAWLRYG